MSKTCNNGVIPRTSMATLIPLENNLHDPKARNAKSGTSVRSRLTSADHNDHETVRFRSGPRSRLCGFELGGWQIDLMREAIYIHGSGAFRSLHDLRDLELPRRGLARDVEFPITAARENLRSVEFRSIDAGADR